MINRKAGDLVMIEGEAFTIVEVLSSSTGNVYKCKSLVGCTCSDVYIHLLRVQILF